ncbi:MAG: hypothetical protein AAGU76_02815 [Sedimentibacter sp.]|uniref:hypothetical protein n=1 Tax=Sedimentibacter sp. TaxID=1960295 RepID=UPI00315974BB
MNNYTYVYDIKQANFFLQEGLIINYVGIHRRTGRTYFAFDRNQEGLQEAFETWKNNRIYTI